MDKQRKALLNLGLTSEEVEQVLKDDAAIEKGEKLFELTSEQKRAEKAAKSVGVRTTATERKPRTQSLDNDKCHLIKMIETALSIHNPTIVNPQREINFSYNGKPYKITLSSPRKV